MNDALLTASATSPLLPGAGTVRHGISLAGMILLFLAGCAGAPATPGYLAFEARMSGANVAPAAVSTTASAIARATLIGNVLTVTGTFTGLSGELRDLHTTPCDPGVHIHPGAKGETNPYLFGIPVTLAPDGRSGTFAGAFTLSDSQVAALRTGRIYVDIHTVAFPQGEVRDQLNAVAAR